MRLRRVFVSVCLLGGAIGAEGVAQTLGRPPTPATRLHDLSYGTWKSLDNPWDYFPPSGIAERQKMLAWVDLLSRRIVTLERSIIRSSESRDISADLEDLSRLRRAANDLRQELVYGSHLGELRVRLSALDAAFESMTRTESTNPAVINFRERSRRLIDDIFSASGPWPDDPRNYAYFRRTAVPAITATKTGKAQNRGDLPASSR